MSLIPWKNKRESHEISPVASLRHEMDRLFDSFFREPLGMTEWSPWGDEKSWMPAVDVAEDDKEVTVRAEMPGIDAKDLNVSVSGNQLTLSGEKKESSETKEKGFYQSETRYGSFHRVISLPEGVDTEKVDAQFANGVLTLKLPKTAPTKQKKIEVKVQ